MEGGGDFFPTEKYSPGQRVKNNTVQVIYANVPTLCVNFLEVLC